MQDQLSYFIKGKDEGNMQSPSTEFKILTISLKICFREIKSRKNVLTKRELDRWLCEYCWEKKSVVWSSLLCPPYSGASESKAILYVWQ